MSLKDWLMPKTPAKTKAQAERTPDAIGSCYRARVYHEIETEKGVKRVDPGMIVSVEKDGIAVYPPELWGDTPVEDQE